MTCHPLVIHKDGTWQAWCKTCGWESASYNAYSWARVAADRHREEQR